MAHPKLQGLSWSNKLLLESTRVGLQSHESTSMSQTTPISVGCFSCRSSKPQSLRHSAANKKNSMHNDEITAQKQLVGSQFCVCRKRAGTKATEANAKACASDFDGRQLLRSD